jgi:hypothetical protein|tara:strand:- start:231 stop:563 length:333 start_codon:yes stop_codon:yes gene_type:complete
VTKFFIILQFFLTVSIVSAESHKLEVAIENCYYAKKFAEIVIEKRKVLRPLTYYEQIDFASPAAMEIIIEAYETDLTEPKFSDGWFKKCQEISCSGFWADLEKATKLVSD